MTQRRQRQASCRFKQKQLNPLPSPQATGASPPHRTPLRAWPPLGVSGRSLGRAGTLKARVSGHAEPCPSEAFPSRWVTRAEPGKDDGPRQGLGKILSSRVRGACVSNPHPQNLLPRAWLESDAPSGEAEARGWLGAGSGLALATHPLAAAPDLHLLLGGNTPTGQAAWVLIPGSGQPQQGGSSLPGWGGLSLDTLPHPAESG